MAYGKQTFEDNVTVLKASHMQHIEDGIVAVENALGTTDGKVSTVEGKVTTLEGQYSDVSGKVTALEGLGIKGTASAVTPIDTPESAEASAIATKVNEIITQLQARGIIS